MSDKGIRSFPEDARRAGFRQELESLINGYSIEGYSNTPDFQLSRYLMTCLAAYEEAVKSRDAWYGIEPSPGWTMGRKEPTDDK